MDLERILSELVREAVREALNEHRMHGYSPNTEPHPMAYTIKAAAEATSMTPSCIRAAIASGELYARQAGSRGAYAIPHDSLMGWLMGRSAQKGKK